MVISKLIDNNIAYYCLHAEAAYCHSNEETVYNRSKEVVHISIYTTSLTKTAIDLVCDDILNDTHCSAFVLDFDGIESVVSSNPIDAVIPKISNLCNKAGKNILLANVKSSIVEQTKSLSLNVAKNSKFLYKNYYTYFSLCDLDCDKLSDYESIFNAAITDKLKKYIKKEVIENPSSSVKLSAYIDIKQLITLEKPFILYCIYRLAKKTWIKWIRGNQMDSKEEQKDSFEPEEKPVLICQSLNGSFIASVLSSLLDLDLFIIDSIGPINKLYRSLGATIKSGKKYIVVSDVVCLGTEVKITKNIIEYWGGIYCGNVSIVRIASFKSYDDVESVFCIDKNNKDEFDYKIFTALDI